MNSIPRDLSYVQTSYGWKISFQAMASPCEVLINNESEWLANHVGLAIANEAWRIEDKYSRYNKNSVCSTINSKAGNVVKIDRETYRLLSFANQCYQLSDGKFDITSGVLRRVWYFDGSDNVPKQELIETLLPHIGWPKVSLSENAICLQDNMEIDFGGIGKEYAVDSSLQIAKQITKAPLLINFGGDLVCSSPQKGNKPWQVGIEHPGFKSKKTVIIEICEGAIATSGDARRYLLKDGIRYSHLLNPKTGRSIIDAPKSMSVAAPNCTQAGFLATLALLQGQSAENFLRQQRIKYWCIW